MRVVVVGAGYIGAELVKQLYLRQCDVIPTTTSGRDLLLRGMPLIAGSSRGEISIPSLPLNVLNATSFQLLPDTFDALVYLVAANARNETGYRESYFEGVSKLATFLRKHRNCCKTLAFVSSTGVYSEDDGGWIDEYSPLVVAGDGLSSWIVKGENAVLEAGFDLSIVCRFSGIYGPGREYLIRKACSLPIGHIEESMKWTNRIHQLDGARAIAHLLEKGRSGIFNITDELPATQIDVMNFIRESRGLDPIGRKSEIHPKGKRCKNQRLTETGFEYLFPSYRDGYAT